MKKTTHILIAIATTLLIVSAACAVSGQVTTQTTPISTAEMTTPTIEAASPPPTLDLHTQEELLTSLYQQVNPGVVAIHVLSSDSMGSSSLGSGFVIDTEGHIVTNYHVVQGASELEVDFPSGYKTRAEILGTDPDSDIAVLKVDVPAEELAPISLGDSDQLMVGQTVVAIGNPHGLYGTMTVGIISSLGRTMQSLHEAPGGAYFTAGGIIQTDAAINPGNSGGPLLNLDGEIIGVNVAIQSATFDSSGQPVNSGIGFTIPINIVKRVVPHLIADGYYNYPYIGIGSLPGGELTLIQQEELGLPQSTGVYILDVSSDSPAETAGLRGANRDENNGFLPLGGDLIIAIDDTEVRNFNDLITYLSMHKSPGDAIILTVLRDGYETQIELTLGERP
ncbi:MAG: trypsin-like peptidase domain-containing protein [Anaerolineae bacterium]|nr:trypsin-like peptidase domain-containing protein [Anaerolineae bacterium]